jgi:hypothetical protein
MPENEIDHVNRNPLDNRIENLREVSRSCNARNTRNRKTNSSGVKGVSFDKKNKKWKAHISVSGKQYTLVRSDDFTEAVCFRLAAEQAFGWPECDKLSTAFLYLKKVTRHIK